MTESSGEPSIELLTAYTDGYKMIREVSRGSHPVQIVDEAWSAAKFKSELMERIVSNLPGVEVSGDLDPKQLAIDVLIAVSDLLSVDEDLRPTLLRIVKQRHAMFEEWLEEVLDED